MRLAALLIGVSLAALSGCGDSGDSGDLKQHDASAAGFAERYRDTFARSAESFEFR